MKASRLLLNLSGRSSTLTPSQNCMSASKRQKLSSMASPKQSSILRFYDPGIKAKDPFGRTQEEILNWSNARLEGSHNYIQMLFPLPEGSPFNFAAPVIDLETMKAFRSNSELRHGLRQSFERMLTFYGFTTSTHPEPEPEDRKDDEEQEQQTTEKARTQTMSTTGEGVVEAQAAATAGSESLTSETTTGATTGKEPSAQPEGPVPELASHTSLSGYYVVRGPNFRTASRKWAVRMDHNHLRISRILRCLRVLGLQKECDAFFAALKQVYDDPAISIGPRSMTFWTRAVQRPLWIAPDDDECDWLKVWEKEQQEEE